MIEGDPCHALYNDDTKMWVVPEESIMEFAEENVYSFGNFSWVDYENDSQIKNISKIELAELLYATHMKKPISAYTWASLNNNFLYLSHDDSFWVKVYLKDVDDYKYVIEHKIRKELKGKRRSIEPISECILNSVFDFCKNGAVFDFENMVETGMGVGVTIYKVGDVGLNAANIHNKFDEQKRIIANEIFLDYNSRSKKWRIY